MNADYIIIENTGCELFSDVIMERFVVVQKINPGEIRISMNWEILK